MKILLSWKGWLRVLESLVDRLRLVNPYSGSQVLAVCRDAADEIERLREQSDGWQATAAGLSEDISNAEDEIERLRAAGDELAERLRWWTDDTDQAYPDHEALRTWEQVARG